MSQLSKLYDIISNARELGLDLGNDVYKQTDVLEEELIKTEILPVIQEQIEPTLRQIKRAITLVVDYVPDVSIRVRMGRESGMYNQEDFVDLTLDPKVEHKTRSGGVKFKRASPSSLRVVRRDGTIIPGKTAAEILATAIKEAGAMKVRELGIVCCRIPLVSTSLDEKYAHTQVEVVPGLYVITHSNNKMKKDYLDLISQSFNLGWKVEVFK